MIGNIEKHLSFVSTALQVHEKRAEILANNLTQADTPGYLAKDLDFKNLLQEIYTQKPLVDSKTTNSMSTDDFVRYRSVLEPSADGNTVDSHIEQMQYANNSLRYMASVTFLQKKLNALLASIKGMR